MLELTLFTVALICEPLANQPISYCKAKYSYLEHLKLAESCNEEGDMEIDILIVATTIGNS